MNALDQPGEWHWQDNTLYYIPPDGEEPRGRGQAAPTGPRPERTRTHPSRRAEHARHVAADGVVGRLRNRERKPYDSVLPNASSDQTDKGIGGSCHMISISAFQDFFRRYHQWVGGGQRHEFDSLARFFNRVRPEMARLQEATLKEQKESAPDFNIFRALRVERREAVLHTPMLAHLLDPSATHGQGLAFLRSFLNMMRRHQCPMLPDELVGGGHWMVLREFYIASVGILNVLIENPVQRCIIIIENKIDAEPHGGQLHRYQAWVEKNRSDYRWRQLIYLTPDGRLSNSNGADSWLSLSYRHDISWFLDDALREVKPPAVRQVVQQYRAILRDLTEDEDDQTR